MNKIGIFSPYLDSLGGGEKYFLTLAECLSGEYAVEIFWKDKQIIKQAEERFNLDLSGVTINKNNYRLFKKRNFLNKLKEIRQYNSLFFLSDGSIPFLFAKNNFIHFQVPYQNLRTSLLTKAKLSLVNTLFCNSKFTKKHIDTKLGVNSKVIYPPVNVNDFSPLEKENIILSVGRYDNLEQNKNQALMIDVFKQMQKKENNNWKFILAGGVSTPEGERNFKKLQENAVEEEIELYKNIGFKKLKELYGKAKIYWHAAGHGQDLRINPQKAEHFGITTVEAMASGCVPVVINAGGQKEIVKHNLNGFLWKTEKDLITMTLKLIKDKNLCKSMSKQALQDSRKYSKDRFCQQIKELLAK